MKDGKFTVGIIGLDFGEWHLKAALEKELEIVGICDKRVDRLNYVGNKHGIPEEKRYTDYNELLAIPELDIVVVATPDQLHREMSVAALELGKNVLCEKPFALTREDVTAMVQAANKEGNGKLMVGQVCRYNPGFMKAKELIDSGAIGELYYVESEYAHDYMRIVQGVTGWRADPLRHGVIGGGCHAIDLLRWIAGDPEEVFAFGNHKLLPTIPTDDATISVLRFPNNVIGKVFVSTGCKRNYTMRSLFYGTKGTIIYEDSSEPLKLFTVDEKDDPIKTPQLFEFGNNSHNTGGEMAAFIDAIVNNKPIPTPAEEGAKTVATCLAIIESAKTGEKVKPDYNFYKA
jgi:predicted dehydrogenase